MSVIRPPAAALPAALLALLVASSVHGQQLPVEREGASDVAVDTRLATLLAGDPLIITADTLLSPADTVQRSVLVLDATLILEGSIGGDLVLVDAGAFVRPRAEVRGDLVNVAGGLYRTELVRVGGAILDLPTAPYRVVREPDRIVIIASVAPSALTFDGGFGFTPPTYDRVNGVTATWGARYTLPMVEEVTPSIHAQVGWRTEPGEPTYALSAELRRFATIVDAGYYRGWSTNDDWIRGDLMNSVNYLWDGDDVRDYHEAELSWAGVRREFGDVQKSLAGSYGVRGQVEDATSLRGGQPWHLLGGDVRPNPAIDPGRTTSLIAGLDVVWHGLQTDFEGGIEYEAAREWLDGDVAYDRVAAHGDWAMHALADHTLEIEFFVQQALGGGTMPRQEWSFVGGTGTLQTVEFGAYQGDRLVFVESKYIIPVPDRVAVPILGAPDLQLIHATGMAWLDGDDRSFRQEVGARLQFFVVYLRYMLDPGDVSNNKLDIGWSMPFGTPYPWARQ